MDRTFVFAALSFLATLSAGQTTPYAGQHLRDIKSLSAAEQAALLEGQGAGLAKAAELNGYPGPAHVVEHADALALTQQQRLSSQELLASHKARARYLGAAIVGAEIALDQAFASRQVDASALSRLVAAIGTLQAQLREEHLRTHLLQTEILTVGQVQHYAKLRGYTKDAAAPLTPGSHRPHH